ncbi:hypothetical protein K0M31_012253 [Melipona bicolor]|uniref:Uncharacterized protein n=1 Tax=Melipona bicolor TaxID=60889 RepID=A0AA40FK81_9HYME|nr:hypothetical protein K0M31_012253 [Melipona bicolor]
MPRVGGDGGGGPEKAGGSGFGGWLGGAARAMTGASVGGGYVVLGGTRYGLRLSQESLPPSNSREESQERRRKRSSRESDSRERLTERCAENAALELSSSIADCCCIGPRSRLPLPRIPPSASNAATTYPTSSLSSTCGTGGGGVVGGAGGGVGGIAGGPVPFPGPPTSSNSRVAGVEQPATLTTPTTSAQPTLVNSNNNRGMLQTSVGNSTGQHHQAQSSAALTAAVPSSSSPSASTSFNTSTAVPTLQSVSVPRQLAQWTKHQTLKLQEPAVIAVDRLHRFRWSGGGGGSSKKSSSGPRSEKAERLRELTEKLKGPAPVPPPRRPSRVQASSPPPTGYQPPSQNYPQATNQGCGRCDGRPSCRSYTYSEGTGHGSGNQQYPQQYQQQQHQLKTINRSDSVGDECLSESSNDAYRKQCTDSRRSSRSVRQHDRNSGDVSDIKNELNASANTAKHLRQYSDSVVDSGTCVDDLCDNPRADVLGTGNEGEARDAITRLEPRGPLLAFHRAGAPFRSASFGQVDFNQGN